MNKRLSKRRNKKNNNKILRKNIKKTRKRRIMRGGAEAAAEGAHIATRRAAQEETVRLISEEEMRKLEDEAPRSFLCPISTQIINDPVIDREGNSYEKDDILQWLERSQVSPLTDSPLTSADLVENRALKNVIELYKNRELQMVNPTPQDMEVTGANRRFAEYASEQLLRVNEGILERIGPEKRSTYDFWSEGGDSKMLYYVQPYQIDGNIRKTVPLWDDNGNHIQEIRENEIFILHDGPENISIKDLHGLNRVRQDCVCAKVDIIKFHEGKCLSGWFNLYELGYMLDIRSDSELPSPEPASAPAPEPGDV